MIPNDNIVYDNRWLAYFDILGFKKLIKQYEGKNGEVGDIDSFVKIRYDGILEEIEKKGERISEDLCKVNFVWFSDSFILFTDDDTLDSYSAIDTMLWEILQKMTWKGHMLRAALSLGEFYSNKERNTYVGPALIKAYEYAEKQEWIGLVLTPEAQSKLSGYAIDKTKYSEYPVPIKLENQEQLFARNIISLKRYIIQAQESAKNQEEYEGKIKVKYENTLKFIEHLENA